MTTNPSHNVMFTPPGPPPFVEGRGHRPNRSLGSTASSITVSDTASGRQAGDSMSNSQLLANSRRPIAFDTGTHVQLHYPYTQRRKSTPGVRTQTMRTWLYARVGLTGVVLCWVVYCTVRYFIAVRTYRGDHVRSGYALGMGITSVFTIAFFSSETYIMLHFSNNQFYRRLKIIVHSLAYLSSSLVLGLTILNLVLVNVWRTPHNPAQFGRSIQGRCYWDFDVVWSGTGMTCPQGGAKPFGDWLGAAIVRSVVSVVFIVGYHLTAHRYAVHREAQRTSAAIDADMGELADCKPSIPAMRPILSRSHFNGPSIVPVAITISEDEHQSRSLSFTAAGQVLSRIEGCELDEGDQGSSTSSPSDQHQGSEELTHPRRFDRDSSVPPLSESSEPLSPIEFFDVPLDSDVSSYSPQSNSSLDSRSEPREFALNPRPSTYLHNIVTPANDLQDFASAFRNLVLCFTQETADGLALEQPTRTRRQTVYVLGANISRMSTIDSMASREASSPKHSPSSVDAPPLNGSGARSRSRTSTVSIRDRGQGELAPSSPSGTGSADGHLP